MVSQVFRLVLLLCDMGIRYHMNAMIVLFDEFWCMTVHKWKSNLQKTVSDWMSECEVYVTSGSKCMIQWICMNCWYFCRLLLKNFICCLLTVGMLLYYCLWSIEIIFQFVIFMIKVFWNVLGMWNWQCVPMMLTCILFCDNMVICDGKDQLCGYLCIYLWLNEIFHCAIAMQCDKLGNCEIFRPLFVFHWGKCDKCDVSWSHTVHFNLWSMASQYCGFSVLCSILYLCKPERTIGYWIIISLSIVLIDELIIVICELIAWSVLVR